MEMENLRKQLKEFGQDIIDQDEKLKGNNIDKLLEIFDDLFSVQIKEEEKEENKK